MLLKILLILAVGGVVVITFAFQVPQSNKDWPQEPDGFNRLKLLATKANVENIVKLEGCKLVPPINSMPVETKQCKVPPLVLDGMNLEGSVQFMVAEGGRDRDCKLAQIVGKFEMAKYATVKMALIKMYGEPHLTKNMIGGTGVFWHGNKTNIMLFSSPTIGSLMLVPSKFNIGDVSYSNQYESGSSMMMGPAER